MSGRVQQNLGFAVLLREQQVTSSYSDSSSPGRANHVSILLEREYRYREHMAVTAQMRAVQHAVHEPMTSTRGA